MGAPAHAPMRWPTGTLDAAQVLLLVAFGVAVVEKGAFYRSSQVVAGGVLAVAALATVAVRRRALAAGVPAAVTAAVAALLALGGWAVIRARMAGDATDGLPVLALTAALSVVLLVGHLATATQRRALQHAMAAVGVVSAASGWIGYVWRIESLALPGSELWRAAGTLTYENALGCVIAAAAVLVTAELVDHRSPGGAVALCVLLVGGAATQSRGGVIALGAGGLVLLACVGWRPVFAAGWRPALGAAVATAALVPSVTVTAPARPGLAMAGMCLGLAIAAAPRRLLPARVLAVAAALALLAGLAGTVIALRQVDLSGLSGRMSLSSPHRVSQHQAAMRLLEDEPVVGTGPGQADLRWRDADGDWLLGRFVHNEYLQVTVELGLVGGALLLAVLGTLARVVWLGWSSDDPLWPGVAAALSAIAMHGTLDFVWHMPVIPLMAVLLAGTVSATRQPLPDDDRAPVPAAAAPVPAASDR